MEKIARRLAGPVAGTVLLWVGARVCHNLNLSLTGLWFSGTLTGMLAVTAAFFVDHKINEEAPVVTKFLVACGHCLKNQPEPVDLTGPVLPKCVFCKQQLSYIAPYKPMVTLWKNGMEYPVTYPLNVVTLDTVRDGVGRFVFREANTFPDQNSLVRFLNTARGVRP